MAIRDLRIVPDEILRKKAKPIAEMTPRLKTLAKDMFNTMTYEDGVGLAAPQVGILKRMFVVLFCAWTSPPIVNKPRINSFFIY